MDEQKIKDMENFTEQKTQEMQNQAERLSVPKAAAVQTGKAEQFRKLYRMLNL